MASSAAGLRRIGLFLLALAVLTGIGLLFFYSAALLVFGVFCFLLGILFLGLQVRSPLEEALREKRKLVSQLEQAEQDFLNRTITETAFKDFSGQKRKELVSLESKIQSLGQKKSGETGNAPEESSLATVSARKKHVLKDLLQRKEALESELKIGEQKYLNRDMEEKEFFDLQHGIQSKLLEVEAEIKGIGQDENIQEVMGELQQKLSDSELPRRLRRRSAQQNEEEAADINEQADAEKKDSAE